ncbi:IS66 family transposase [Hydrotalea sp.]|uniref:IS66 family transposase n=1 Tax=Hydrotalea sp. TaxID=2881279 RepID=UPI002615D267|nr:IS66 family transposase [Hydrotalea sp.]
MIETAIDYKVLYEESTLEITSLKHELANLKRLIFGSKNERFIPAKSSPSQLSLDIQAEVVAACSVTNTQKIEYICNTTQSDSNRIKEHPGRTKLPEHLERRKIIIEPAAVTEGCKKIGEEITEELEYEPGKLFVNRYVRPKYVQANNNGIIIAPMIDRPMPKAIVGSGLLAQIIIDKYVDHLPLYRQMERFKREGINIPYSTIGDWIKNGCNLIDPLYESLKKLIVQSNYLHADESPIKVLDKDKKGTLAGSVHRGYYWVYHNSIDGLVWFDYQEGRGREGPVEVLKDFKGYLQTDGYTVYDFFKEEKDITVLHCMAHARRMFFEAKNNDKVVAEYALEQIGLLYNIERQAKEQQLDQEQILQLRQTEALPILESLGKWMKETYIKTLPKSAIGKALGYSIQRWPELMLYATDGRLNIDNNSVENSIKPVAIGRKNYLFAGSHEATKRSAMLYSLMGTCKLHGINPFIWLRDVLQRIANHPINKPRFCSRGF